MSEKLYWLILIAAFTGFGLLTWVWLIPDGIVEYNLGVNLLTSSVFMVFTIVFLSWLSRLREELQWKLARDQLHQELGARLFSISRQIFLLIDQALTGEMPQIAFVKRLEELCDGSEENLRQTVEMAFMQSEREISTIIKGWARRDRDFISMEMRNFQSFFAPKLRIQMIGILSALGDLEYLLDLKEKYSLMSSHLQGQHIADLYLGRISFSLHLLLKRIREVGEMGVEIYRPKWLCTTCGRPVETSGAHNCEPAVPYSSA